MGEIQPRAESSGLVGLAPDGGDARKAHLPVDPLAGAAKLWLHHVVQAVQPHCGGFSCSSTSRRLNAWLRWFRCEGLRFSQP